MKHNQFALRTLAAALLLAQAPAFATNGYVLPGYGIRAQGMGGAGMAYGTDSLSIASNPANIVNTGMRGDMGVSAFNAVRHAAVGSDAAAADPSLPFKDPGFGFNGSVTSNRNWFLMPEAGMTMPLTENLHAGIAFEPNGGGSTVYPLNFYSYSGVSPDDPGRGATLGGELMQLLAPITVGYKLNEHHAIGAALDVAVQRFRMYGVHSFKTFSDAFKVPVTSDSVHLSDNGYDYSFGAGLKLGWLGSFLDDRLSVGLTYTSRTYMSKFEKYRGLFAEHGDFDIPANYGIGLAFKPKKNIVIAADVERIEWSSVAALGDRGPGTSIKPYPGPSGGINAIHGIPSTFCKPSLPIDDTNCPTATGNVNGMGFGWQDQTVYKLGVNWGVNERLQLRAGYNYGHTPIPNDQLTFGALFPATTERHYTVGFTYKATDELEITGVYVRVPEKDQHSPNNQQNVVGQADIGMRQQMIGLSLGWVLDPGKMDYGDAPMDPISFAGWYFGFGAGQDKGRDWNADRFASSLASKGVTSTQTGSDPVDLGIKVFGGYQLNKYFAMEGGYTQLNNFKAQGTGIGGNAGPYQTQKNNTWVLSAVGTLPVTKDFSVFGKLGVNHWKSITTTLIFNADPAVLNYDRTQTTERGTDPYYGVGASYSLMEGLDIRGEYERFDFGGAKIDLLSAGMAVRF